MTDSLTLSLLLLCALLIFAVLARELWRIARLRRERIRELPRGQSARSPQPGARMAGLSRQEPGLDSLVASAPPQVEPELSIPDPRPPGQELDPPESMARGEGGVDPARAPSASSGVLDADPPRGSIGNASPVLFAEDPHDQTGRQGSSDPLQGADRPDERWSGTATVTASQSDASWAAPDQRADQIHPVPTNARAPLEGGPDLSGPLRSGAAAVSVSSATLPLDSEPPAGPRPLESEVRQTAPGRPPSPGDRTNAQIPPVEPLPLLSPTTDCIVELNFAAPVPGDRLATLAQSFRRCGTKPVLIEMLAHDQSPAATRYWISPRSGGNARTLRIGILLDNRSGPLNAMEFSEFLSRVQEVAERLGARYAPPVMSEVLQAARRLDADCAQLDWTAGLNVDASESLGPAQLAGLAAPLLIVERGSNRYARLDDFGDPVFSVTLGDRPSRLSFLLDLPRVHAPQEAWSAMVDCALIAAKRLPGRLVDDAGKPLSQRFLDASAGQVRQKALALEAFGLKAGSALARRVFN